MTQNPWNRPLPSDIVLGGEKKFTHPLPDPTQSWVITAGNPSSSTLGVKSRFSNRSGEILLQARYNEGLLESHSPREFPLPPTLSQMSWDWIEYHCQPLQDLMVEVINWVPDPRVICGRHRIHNNGSQRREITLKLTCQDELGRRGIRLSKETYQGRKILSGRSKDENLVLFLAGSETAPPGPSNQLVATFTLEPAGLTEIHWILICCDSDTDAHKTMDKVIRLDWDGELARRKIALSSQLQIITGNADWDFSLAFSQRQARTLLNQLILQTENCGRSDLALDPLQAWQLYLALTPLQTSNLEWLLRTTFQENPGKITSYPLEAELFWRAQQVGISQDLLKEFLPVVERNLNSWFSSNNDKDQDGVPEGPGKTLFDAGLYSSQEESLSIDPSQGDEYIETPGLAALLHNEICQLEKLQEMVPGSRIPLEFSKRKRKLADFILSSWEGGESRFRARDYQTHLSERGYALPGPIQNGWNILRAKLPYPARLTMQIPRTSENPIPGDLQVTFQGTDWQGRYRVETLTSQDILRYDSAGWGTTETIFSQLDYCIVLGLEGTQNILLLAPRSDKRDLSLTLPLWVEDLPVEMRENMINGSLAAPSSFWSAYGLKSCPLPGSSPVQLPLNLLVCQGLIKAGHTRLAGDIFKLWMDAISINLTQTGCLYSSWESQTGTRLGKGNQLESTLPIGLLLDLVGVRFLIDGDIILEEREPVLFPVQLNYRGVEITLAERESTVAQPGGDIFTLPRGKKAVIQF